MLQHDELRDTEVAADFAVLCDEYPVVLVTGMRRAGKTTMLEHCLEEGRRRVTLDDLDERARSGGPGALPAGAPPARHGGRGAAGVLDAQTLYVLVRAL